MLLRCMENIPLGQDDPRNDFMQVLTEHVTIREWRNRKNPAPIQTSVTYLYLELLMLAGR